jgi:hypothetical protein
MTTPTRPPRTHRRHATLTRVVAVAVASLLAGGALAAGAVATGAVTALRVEPAPVAPAPVGPWDSATGAGIIDAVKVNRYLVGDQIGLPSAFDLVSTRPQIRAWLAEFGGGLQGLYDTGELDIRVADSITADTGGGGVPLLGVASPGGIMLASTGFNPRVLAHEIGHWYQYRNPSVVSRGLESIGNYEIDADAIGSILTAGDPGGTTMDVSKADIDFAVLVMTGAALPVSPSPKSALTTIREGGSPYATFAYQPGLVDVVTTYPGEAYLVAARARAGFTPGTQGLVDQANANAKPTVEDLRAGVTFMDTDWLTSTGVEVWYVREVRSTWGSAAVVAGSVVAIDDMVSEPKTQRLAAERVAATVPGLSRCWAPALAYAVDGYLNPTPWDGVYAPESLGWCTRAEVLHDGALWAASGRSVATPVTPTIDSDPSRLATKGDFTEALAAAGVVEQSSLGGSGW